MSIAPNRFLADRQWRELFDQLRLALREAAELEPRLVDESAPEEEWTRTWADYAGLIARAGFLQQRLLARRIALLED
ncbi:MAG: hypothetical protein ACRDF0_03885 [Candidatus Limnocylindria bacterium]